MKFNVNNMLLEAEQNELEQEPDEKIWYDTETKTFYEPTEDGWEPIKGPRAIQLKDEYRRQKYLERHPETTDLDKAEKDRIARIKAKWSGKNFSDMSNKISDEAKKIKSEKQKEITLRAKTLELQQASDWDSIQVATSAEEIYQDIKKDLQDNILDNDDSYYDWEQTYNRPNSFTVDPNIILKSDTYEEQPPDDEDKPKPYIYFFFDRSYSFNGNGKLPDGTWRDKLAGAKTDFGYNVENALKNAMNNGEVLFKTYYFASSVHDNEQAALAQGGNDGNRLVRFIDNLTNGHPSNVVIVTDSDSSTSYSDVLIDGGVWIIFCDKQAPSLTAAFKSTKGIVKSYFVEDIWT